MPPAYGLCKLTGNAGKFVRAHIIPRALAPPTPGGEAFAQIGQRRRPTRRRDSWYDERLVIRAGEDILTAYDTWAVTELRRLKLIWQSWGPMHVLATPDFRTIANTSLGLRLVEFKDPHRMRIFLLSLLWRAAASELPEMSEVNLHASDLRRLRRAIVSGSPPPTSFMPVSLVQLSTIGRMHNHGPITQIKSIPKVGGESAKNEPIVRIYFDGLIAHFHTEADERTLEGLGSMAVGGQSLLLNTVEYEASWQLENLRNCFADSEHEFPGAITRASGGPVAPP
jgi:hypothetical protein